MPYDFSTTHNQKLAPTLSSVTQEGQRISSEKDEYKDLFEQLAGSEFVRQMRELHTNIIE